MRYNQLAWSCLVEMEIENRESFFRESHIISSTFNTSKALTEQALHCLECVAQLNEVGLNFVFKGGNTLLLILEKPERFSNDVDISTDESIEKIEQCLTKITGNNSVFKKWEKRQHKTKPWLPMTSYYLYYVSLFTPTESNTIMLDVQLKKSKYPTVFKPISCGRLFISNITTELPLPSGIIVDKLLALGPFTLGIPLNKNKEAQRLKHIFDISRLLNTKPSLTQIRNSIEVCLEQENQFQKKSSTLETIIVDTISMLWSSVSPQDTFKWGIKEIYNEHKQGLQPFSSHLFQNNYSWSQMQIDMSRVALCIAAAGNKQVTDSEFLQALEAPFNTGSLPFPILLNNPKARNYWEAASLWVEPLFS
jgi:hypothetical protein